MCEKPNSKPSVPNQESNLMIKAVKQFGGVWPDQEETHLYKFHDGRFVTGMLDGTADVVCTREQFEAFVESLFDVAPSSTQFYSFEDNSYYPAFWRMVDDIWQVWPLDGFNCEWLVSSRTDKVPAKLIPRPSQREKQPVQSEPEQPYMPKVGEECEYRNPNGVSNAYYWMFFVGYDKDGSMVIQRKDKSFRIYRRENNLIFRPVITEREKFIDDHKADVYLYAINTSELISMKQSTGEDLAARVLGYMHDAGFKSP